VLATALVSGISTFVNGFAVAGTDSDAFVTVRNLAVAGLIAPAALLVARRSGDRLRGSDWGRLAVIGLVGGAVPFVLFFRGLQLATADGGATTASFLYRTLFLWATVLGVLVLRERPSWIVAGATGLLLSGNLLLLRLTSPVWTDGSLYVVAATGLWAVEYTLSKRVLRELSAGTVALGRMGFGGVFLLGFLAISGQTTGVLRFSGAEWGWVAVSAGLLAAFVATWYAGLRRMDLGAASSVLVLGFPVTVALSAAVKGTSTPSIVAVGAGLVLLGALVAAGPERLRAAVGVVAPPRSRPGAGA
jgi:drug/metabolite transporter (DMT)-like permease